MFFHDFLCFQCLLRSIETNLFIEMRFLWFVILCHLGIALLTRFDIRSLYNSALSLIIRLSHNLLNLGVWLEGQILFTLSTIHFSDLLIVCLLLLDKFLSNAHTTLSACLEHLGTSVLF